MILSYCEFIGRGYFLKIFQSEEYETNVISFLGGHHSDTETESESCDSDDCIDDSDERSGNASVDEQQIDNKAKVTRVKMSESKKHSTIAKREVSLRDFCL